MSRIDLHKFEQDLKNKPGLGSMDAPRTIKAKKLDDNNKKLTLLKGEGEPPPYQVKYTPEGTIITDIQGLPANAIAKEFDVCENGTPTSYWFVVWNNEPTLPPATA
jgi:hypothetical protein